ncbi:MAG: SDR family oxidoreductase [Ottowia sp.]|uniref:SDR family NAD(P)-dependent oxidoreductase n=1 Tax=Ottowia sp. TaxID=1898956 RepID=UPI003C79492C
MTKENEFKGAVAIVTGGARGIGLAIAEALAQEGSDLLLVGRDRQALAEAERSLSGAGRRVVGISADVTKPSEVSVISETLRRQFEGRADIIVTAAGRRDHENKPLDEMDVSNIEELMEGNLMGTLLPIREVLPLMKARRHGKVVAISGVYGLKGRARHMAGCTSKWAVEGMVRVLALELGPFNINVNAVCPGYVEGPRSAAGMASAAAARGMQAEQVRMELEQACALRRLSTAEDVANAALFLASARARNITGRDLIVDGGWML